MRILLYIVILALLVLAPVQRLDVAKLEPVQTVALSVVDGMFVIKTDTKNTGRGKDLAAAIEDLESNTPGVIYLDTAQYLLLAENAKDYAGWLEKYLRKSVRVSLWDGKGSVENASKFLGIHDDLPTLRRWNRDAKKAVKKT